MLNLQNHPSLIPTKFILKSNKKIFHISINQPSNFVQTIKQDISKEHIYHPQVTCVINIENWSKWLLDDPVYFIKYGAFRPSNSSFNQHHIFKNLQWWFQFDIRIILEPMLWMKKHDFMILSVLYWKKTLVDGIHFLFPVFHEREVFPSHREVVVVENDGDDRWTHLMVYHYLFCKTNFFSPTFCNEAFSFL